ncbi:DMT family transporter [Vagococcus carniphilus]|uniref:DMT family transporter n=1 Tax=Vagococcus carniphilus TaxID=218144 RepID=A0A430APY8_9ENTE|nr:DMT family transporter [Vagococcus carniphilus]QNN72569.1 DMT family transporter [Vagococcus carniphilus]RSU10191.1 hypothetical protein CBF28_13930 [Vagococcus carniphilus]
MTFLLFIFLGIMAGAFFPVQATINSRLGSIAKNPIVASFTAFSVGSIVLFLFILFFDLQSLLSINITEKPILFIAGPLAGVIFNVANIILFTQIGATITTIITITGQMIMGILIDHFGLFGMPVQSLSIKRLLGVTIMLGAIWLFQKSKTNIATNTNIPKKWLVIGLVAGIFPPLQASFNGELRETVQSVLVATFISFFVGALLLAGILLVKDKKIKIPRKDELGIKLPWWTYIGGLFGILIVGGNILVIRELGSVLTTIVFIFGQLLMAVIIDQFGLFKMMKRKIEKGQLVALALIVIALFLV